MKCNCKYCGKEIEKTIGHYNRAKKMNMSLYCNQICFGMDRRKNYSIEEKKRLKAEYDRKNRKEYSDKIKAEKAAYFKRTYDPIKAAIIRKERMPKHVEYCRKPEYKAKKKDYDQKHRAQINYGEFWESSIILEKLEAEIGSKIEANILNNTYNKSLKRKRLWKSSQQKT